MSRDNTESTGTILVLGAGASEPYGFPLGRTLRADVITDVSNPNSDVRDDLVGSGFDDALLDSFAKDLKYAIHETLDEFLLDMGDTYRHLGGYVIARRMLEYERKLHVRQHHDWYPLLYRWLQPVEGDSSIKGIITFNYERSLNHYLHTTVISCPSGKGG